MSYKDYEQACLDKVSEWLSPSEVLEVKVWMKGPLPDGFWDTVSKNARSAILELCSLGLG